MTIELGAEPQGLAVRLADGYPFVSTLVRTTRNGTAENWPSAPSLVFGDDTVWETTLTGNEAAFSEDVTEVSRILALSDRSVTLVAGGMLWARGGVEPV